jgi:branched-chain amino acid transport system substrate-binding protein
MPPLPDQGEAGQPALPVAVLTPLSGELATFGEAVRNGVGLALDEWNARGGASGQRLQAVWVDTPCEAGAAEDAAEQVIADGVQFIIGGMCSEAAVPIARVADERGALFVATGGTHPRVTVAPDGSTRRLVFTAAFPYPYQGRAAARFLVETLGITRTAVLVRANDPFGRDVAATFEPTMIAAGGRVVTPTIIAGPDVDLVPAAVEGGAQALYVPGDASLVEQVNRAAVAAGVAVAVVGSDWWARRELDLAALEGAYLIAHYSAADSDTAAQAWALRYRAAYSLEPDALAALGYDAANLLATSIKAAADVTPAEVARVIATTAYTGVTGSWQFDARHNPLKEAVFVQVRGGQLHRVGVGDVR